MYNEEVNTNKENEILLLNRGASLEEKPSERELNKPMTEPNEHVIKNDPPDEELVRQFKNYSRQHTKKISVLNYKKENIIFANKDEANLEELNRNAEVKIHIEEEKEIENPYADHHQLFEEVVPEEVPITIKVDDNVTMSPLVEDDVNLEFLFKQLGDIENVIIIEEDDIPEEIVILEGSQKSKPEGERTPAGEVAVEMAVRNNDLNISERANINPIEPNINEEVPKRLESKEGVVPHEPLVDEKSVEKPKVTVEPVEPVFVEPVVKMKDKKILVNLEDLEKEYSKKEQYLFGEINYENKEEMKQLNQEIELQHPRIVKNGMVMQYPVCNNMGNFGCSNTKINNNLKELGLGMMCYFKVLKIFIWCFFLISILNIHLYYVYSTSNSQKKITGYRDLLFKTTIGNIASSIN
jgi:hypothetical protein